MHTETIRRFPRKSRKKPSENRRRFERFFTQTKRKIKKTVSSRSYLKLFSNGTESINEKLCSI